VVSQWYHYQYMMLLCVFIEMRLAWCYTRSHSGITVVSLSVHDVTLCVYRDASGMVLHKESQWYQSWQSFKDNNQFVHSKSVSQSCLCIVFL